MGGQADELEIVSIEGGIEIAVKVVPGASRTKVVGTWGTALKVAVAAPPEGGKANAAVAKLLASFLGVRKGDVTIIAGFGQALKRVAVAGLSVEQVRERVAGM